MVFQNLKVFKRMTICKLNKMTFRQLINVQSLGKIPTVYPYDFINFCNKHNLKPPNITSKNGKALVVMLTNKQSYFDRNTCNEFVNKFCIETKDSIQLFNKHEQWGVSCSKEKAKYYIEFPYKLTNKPKMRKNFKFGGSEEEKIEEINNIKSRIQADYIDIPHHMWQLGHKNPESDDCSTFNLVLQPPIQAKYRDNYIFLDTITKIPTPKHFKKCVMNDNIKLTNEQIKEFRDMFQEMLDLINQLDKVNNDDKIDDPLSNHLQRSLHIL